jgi:predicted nucleic acid-binding protein
VTERCVDASVAVKWVLRGEPFRAKARALLNDSRRLGIVLIAPYFFACETDSVIRKHVFAGTLTPAAAARAHAFLDAAPVQLLTIPGLRQRAREIAAQFNQRAVYDATYAALAELRGCDFWTADRAFYDDVKAVLTFVKYLANYP